MSYVVSFYGYQPLPRYDSIPWTQARISECATKTGTYSILETQALSPVDSDPSKPAYRNFTTHLATLSSGWYIITFLDGSGNVSDTAPVFHGPAATTLASIDDVIRIMKLPTTPDATTTAQLQEALEVADALIRTQIQRFDVTSGTGVHHHVVPGAGLPLDVNDATVTQVRAYLTPGADAVVVSTNLWQVGGAPRGPKTHLLLENQIWDAPWPIGYGRHELEGQTLGPRLARVEIDWTYNNGVPKPVRDAIAMTAATLWSQGPKFISGLRSETIGDYSYTFDFAKSGRDVEKLIPAAALSLLAPYRARSLPFVT